MKRKFIPALILALVFCSFGSFADLKVTESTFAATETKTHTAGEKYIYITTEPYTDGDENHKPMESFEEEGYQYDLTNVEYRETVIPGGVELVEDTILYEGIALDSEIPYEANISVKDEALGGAEIETVVGRLTNHHFDNLRWRDFSFSIVCEEPDAEDFDLNGTEVQINEEAPLSEYRDLLLDAIGADPEYYQIEEIRWEGDVYEQDGVPCRNLRAYGKAQIGDCYATYKADHKMPDVKARECVATYTRRDEPEEVVEETVPTEPESVAPVVVTTDDDPLKGFLRWLAELLKKIGRLVVKAVEWATETPARTFVSISTLLILGFIIWFLVFIAKKAKKEKEKMKKNR